MSLERIQTTLQGEIVESLNVAPRRMSKFSLFWYLKSLPEHSLGAIVTLIPVIIGTVLALGLLIDRAVHRVVPQEQIDTVLNYDYSQVDDEKLDQWIEQARQWLNSPQFVDWAATIPIWMIVVPLLVVIGLVVGWFVMRLLQWRRIRFGVSDGMLWLSGGLFTTWTRRLPIVHVQSLEFRSTLLQRMFMLRSVAISSAAPEGKNASIELLAVNRGLATDVSSVMQTAFGTTIATPESGDAGSELIASVGWKQLIVAAANSFEVRFSIFSLFVLYQFLGNIEETKHWRDRAIHSVTSYAGAHHNFWNLVFLAIGAVLFFWVFAVGNYILTFARFRLRRSDRLALIEHGLITRRWRTVLMPHVQALSFVESPLQQRFGSGSLRMTLPGTMRNEVERTMLLPALHRDVSFSVLDRLFAGIAVGTGDVMRSLEASLQRLPPSARRSYLLRWSYRALPVSLVLCVLLTLVPNVNPLWGLVPFAVFGPIGAIVGNARFHDAGWVLDDHGRLAVRERAFSRTTRLTGRRRVIWSRISVMRLFTGKNVTFVASVAGAGSRPGLLAKILGYGLVARSDSRMRVRGILHDDALALVERLSHSAGSASASQRDSR